MNNGLINVESIALTITLLGKVKDCLRDGDTVEALNLISWVTERLNDLYAVMSFFADAKDNRVTVFRG